MADPIANWLWARWIIKKLRKKKVQIDPNPPQTPEPEFEPSHPDTIPDRLENDAKKDMDTEPEL